MGEFFDKDLLQLFDFERFISWPIMALPRPDDIVDHGGGPRLDAAAIAIGHLMQADCRVSEPVGFPPRGDRGEKYRPDDRLRACRRGMAGTGARVRFSSRQTARYRRNFPLRQFPDMIRNNNGFGFRPQFRNPLPAKSSVVQIRGFRRIQRFTGMSRTSSSDRPGGAATPSR